VEKITLPPENFNEHLNTFPLPSAVEHTNFSDKQNIPKLITAK
jgi:hypothetical protein